MIQSQSNAANVFTDINGLQDIRALGKNDQEAALKEVAKQFESMFMSMMLKSMRDASDVFSEDSLFNSPESDFYRNMYDDQLSVSLTSGQGTGLADVIHRQLMSQYGLDDKSTGVVDQSKIFDRRYSGLSTAMQRVEEVARLGENMLDEVIAQSLALSRFAFRRVDLDEIQNPLRRGRPRGPALHEHAPRVLIANSNLVGRWANWEHFHELERRGLMMYGQMTAGSWIYIGTQGILQGTYETFGAMAQ